MPKHYAMGVNIQQGRIEFMGTKLMKIYYSLSFAQMPLVRVNLTETETSPNYTLNVSTEFFIIKFSNPYTGTLIWEASA